MDCRNFKEMLDSYLSGELTVETNHACLRHAEQCPACRTELAARRHLRATLRTAAQRTGLSAEAQARLRARLREEMEPVRAARAGFWQRVAAFGFFSGWLSQPVAVLTVVLLAMLGALSVYWLRTKNQPAEVALAHELSPAMFEQAAGDHRTCATKFTGPQIAAVTPGWMKEKYPMFDGLVEAAAPGAQDLQLRTVHLCGFGGRRFVHLVYGWENQVVSLLVTQRDAQALRLGQIPSDDGHSGDPQHALYEGYEVSAQQTARYVVLIVSALPAAQNQALTERLAVPVSAHLRRTEKKLAWFAPESEKQLAATQQHSLGEGARQ